MVAVREAGAALLRLESIDHAAAVRIRLSRLPATLRNLANLVCTSASCTGRAPSLDEDQGASVRRGDQLSGEPPRDVYTLLVAIQSQGSYKIQVRAKLHISLGC